MADEYGFPNTEEEFKALIDELLGKVPDEKTQQANARQALSEIIGIDLDKIAALIEDDAADQIDEKTEDLQTQEEPESETGLISDDMFGALDPNGLSDVYHAEELNIGAVVSIGGMEVFHILAMHDDHAHTAWIDPMGRVMSDYGMAHLARETNAANGATNVTRIIHLA